MIIEHEGASRERIAREALALADAHLSHARERVTSDRSLIALTREKWRVAELPHERSVHAVNLGLLRKQLAEAEQNVDLAEAERASLSLGMLMEQNRMGLEFAIADEGTIATTEKEQRRLLLGISLLVWLGAAPWVALLIGAFDPYLRTRTDVRQSGVRLLGSVHSFSRG
jgi:hypothetical protein